MSIVTPPDASYVPREEDRNMRDAYGGKKCVLSLSGNAVHYAHLIPYKETLGIPMLAHFLRRKLRERRASHEGQTTENLFPLKADHREDFDDFKWTIFPPLEVLEKVIVFEEGWQAYRQGRFRAGFGDPGRPDFYFGRNVSSPYDVHWGANAMTVLWRQPSPSAPPIVYVPMRDCPGSDPPSPGQITFPKLQLLVGIPNVVVTCLPRLASLPKRNSLQRNLLRAGAYLVDLWNWDVGDPPVDGRLPYLRNAVYNGHAPHRPPSPSILYTSLVHPQCHIFGPYSSQPATGNRHATVPTTAASETLIPKLSTLPDSPTSTGNKFNPRFTIAHPMPLTPPASLQCPVYAQYLSLPAALSPLSDNKESIDDEEETSAPISKEETIARVETRRETVVVDFDVKVPLVEETIPESSLDKHATANDAMFMIGAMKGSSWLQALHMPVD